MARKKKEETKLVPVKNNIERGSNAVVGLTEDTIALALENNNGMRASAARELGVTAKSLVYHIDIKKNQRLLDIIDTYNELKLDLAEEKLTDALHAGKSWAIQFVLKYKGHNRGYVEKPIQEIPKLPIVFNFISGDVVQNKVGN